MHGVSPEKLKRVAKEVREVGYAVYRLNELLDWFDSKAKGPKVTERLRHALNDLGLRTVPAFDRRDLRSDVELVFVPQEPPIVSADWGWERWKEEWEAFFKGCLPALAEVVLAHGCREGWLQAEAFRYFRKHPSFYCNFAHMSEDGRCKADFAAYLSERRNARATFLGECKIVSISRSQPKVVTGAHADVGRILRRHPEGGAIVFGNDDDTWSYLHERRFSVLSDYYRLVNAPCRNASTERVLFLVLHKPAGEETTEAGRLLMRLQFEDERPAIHIEEGELEVRGWRVRGRKGRK